MTVAGGWNHSLALDRNGYVVAWGDNTSGQTNVPVGVSNALAIAAGAYHSLLITSNATVMAWGNNFSGQCTVPAAVTNAVAVAGGGRHSVALLSNGIVVAWGDNSLGQTNVPPAATNVTAIAAGSWHTLALMYGRVIAWGDNSVGQCTVPAGLTNVIAVAAGWGHSLALRSDGTVVAWGANVDWTARIVNQAVVPSGITNAVAIAAGALHSLVLLATDTVVAWGDNSSGQASPPAGLTNLVSLAAGSQHSLALAGTGGPWITRQPVSQTVFRGADIIFTVDAVGLPPLLYQWQAFGTNLMGETNRCLLLTNVQPAMATNYNVTVRRSGIIYFRKSVDAWLTVVDGAPVALLPLFSQAVFSGSTVVFDAGADGTRPLFYQWRVGGANLLGATDSLLVLPAVTTADQGAYSVVISNSLGTLTNAGAV